MCPGLLGDGNTARRAFESSSYDNRIGVAARADRIDDPATSLADRWMTVRPRYGVRVFTDTAATDAVVPGEPELSALLASSAGSTLPLRPPTPWCPENPNGRRCWREERAGVSEPYRWVAASTHVIAGSAGQHASE